MSKSRLLSAVAMLAVVLGQGGAAQADPFADGWVDFNPVTSGTNYNGSTLNTSSDNDTDGIDALGAPDWNGSFSTGTVLGFDANAANGPEGGTLIVKFMNNTCIDGPGPDIKIYDAYGSQSTTGNESGSVEVSNDGGQTFVKIGEVGPAIGFEVDVAGAVPQFNQVRMTAMDSAGLNSAAGLDVDAVECLNSIASSIPAPGTDPGPDPDESAAADTGGDGCDLMGGSDGADVSDVAVSSDGLSLDVTLNLCGAVSDKASYTVYFDYKGSRKSNGRAWGDGRKTDKKANKKKHKRDVDDDDVAAQLFADGPDTLVTSRNCANTADTVATYRRGKARGPGLFMVDGDQLSLQVDYGELGLPTGAELLVWVRTHERKRRRLGDSVPNVEKGDRCHKPQFEHEVFAVTLE